ncbi:phosphoacetylglucosamine mutase isoform X1 [Venturia canescens]|uniref:phosphoacetylglucosamine mutase isoform X1 n=2 Tax=Venturia canescens TaxID=32260 RepID=UPI001C9C19C9|nr:phosphoacetylglucosamine mutase isoform X1 [Venturia canescens]
MNYTEIDRISRNEHSNTSNVTIQYGTAGFRTKANLLDHVMFRMGVLATLRSRAKNAAIGVMITASHNEEPDNGLKLVDPAGEMLEATWEIIATEVANVPDSELVQTLRRIVQDYKITEDGTARVIVGRDTRRTSESLSAALIQGVNSAGGIALDFGVVTTPQLHYLVVSINENKRWESVKIDAYYGKLGEAFKRACSPIKVNGNYIRELVLDAANGVGAVAAKEFKKRLVDYLAIEIFNEGDGELNHNCGADYVKVRQAPPMNVPTKTNVRCVSIDGDADRIVYYYVDDKKKFHLLDGDRIATLVAEYFKELIGASGLSIQLGLVQTAYANGASTNYIKNNLKIPVACVPTGVKHLHQRAMEFEIGVYFEANGHGTVIFKNSVVEKIREASKDSEKSKIQQDSASRLADLVDVINQSVGDALSDMLLVETILYAKGWDLVTWEKSYTDLPNRQLKVRVADRNLITTTDAERKCVTPRGLQEKIDELVALYPKGRSFVRPSGTEDIVRVYAECENTVDVEKLVAQVSRVVYQMANGIGSEPVVPT